jgi:DNA-binding response OmpR family regulator
MSTMSNQELTTILLVEDDPGHARLVEKNLRRASIANRLVTLSDGQAVIDFLSDSECSAETTHMMVLLDLNMPILDGFQVLQWLRANEHTQKIPVVVLTTTDDSREKARCFELGCDMYLTKPLDYEQFNSVVQAIEIFLAVNSTAKGESA